MNTEPQHILTTPEPGIDEVDFTAVGRVLADAAVLVRTRGELGEHTTPDKRPRIAAAIARAADLAGVTGAAGRPVRDWACVLAAMQINAALGRGRYRDHPDVAASALTLDGFGLDVGTIGAVNTAADLLAQAAATADLIAAAQPVPVHGHGPVTAYPLGVVRAVDVETDDIVAVDFTSLHTGDINPPPGDPPLLVRVREAGIGRDATRTLVLDLAAGPLSLPVDTAWCATGWRPVPHLHHPRQPHRASSPG